MTFIWNTLYSYQKGRRKTFFYVLTNRVYLPLKQKTNRVYNSCGIEQIQRINRICHFLQDFSCKNGKREFSQG